METPIEVHRGSGNVFLDLGLENAEELLTKADIAHKIIKRMNELNLTPIELSKHLDIELLQAFDLISGKAWVFSIEELNLFLKTLKKVKLVSE